MQAIIIKNNIKHFPCEEIRKEYIQVTMVTVLFSNAELYLAAMYCPPRHNIVKEQFEDILNKLEVRFILGGDFNAKHTAWRSRLIIPKRRALYEAIEDCAGKYHSPRRPTFWPSDIDRLPDLLDLFITRGTSSSYIQIVNVDNLTSDHIPVSMMLSTTVIRRKKKLTIINKHTNWNKFREKLDEQINLKIRLKTTRELEDQTGEFVEAICRAARASTPTPKNTMIQEVCYPMEIRAMIKGRRRSRRIWHQSKNPEDKKIFNRIRNQLNKLIKESKSFEAYLEELFRSRHQLFIVEGNK